MGGSDFSFVSTFLRKKVDFNTFAISDDEDFLKNNEKELATRDNHYSMILEQFLNEYKRKSVQKHTFKAIFFIVMMISSVVIAVACAVLMVFYWNDSAITAVTTISGLVSATIGIPLTVARYLFNPKEDFSINDMVIQMRKHDLANIRMNENHPKDRPEFQNSDKEMI